MEFDWDNDQRSFRATVKEFLSAHLPENWEALARGPGTEWQSTFSRQFCAELASAGLLVPHWPARWGGRDADAWVAFILAEEMWAAGEPREKASLDGRNDEGLRIGADEEELGMTGGIAHRRLRPGRSRPETHRKLKHARAWPARTRRLSARNR